MAFFFLLKVCVLFGQEEWINLDLSDLLTDKVQAVYPIMNEQSGYFATFIKSDDEIIGFYNDDKQTLLTTLKIKLPFNFLDVFIGSTYDGANFTLFFSDSSETKHSCIKVDFATNRYAIIEAITIINKKERVISYIEMNASLHLITVSKKASLLHRKTLKLDGSVNEATYDLSRETFETDNGLPLTFDALLFGKKSQNAFQTINTNVPNSLEQTSAVTKIYQNEKQIRLTNNSYQKKTYILDLDCNTNAYKLSTVENQNFDKKNTKSNANSFILDEWFFDTYSTTDGITLNIYDANTKQLNKTLTIIPGDSIAFKNTPIIHDSGTSNPIRDLEKTSRFVRKVNSSNIGVAAYALKDKYIVTLGATHKRPNLGLVVVGAFIGGFAGAALFSTFDAYGRTQSTHIQCLFDTDFNHVTGALPKNGFDLINAFLLEQNLKYSRTQTVFKYHDTYIWGYYKKAEKSYRFHQFNSFEE